MFAKVMSVVLGILGISAFAKDEKGKSILLSTQEEELRRKYGDVFLESLKRISRNLKRTVKVRKMRLPMK